MSAAALEMAMALHQAPIQRFALRDRPLPEDIGVALQLASAMQPQLENAAAQFSESEEVVLEAVRFYLHQVLFEPGTDAYRVLGLSPGADSKKIRQHYLWLQRWLHPDRRGEDWEAVFTTKVNWAWQQLRNPASREVYDQSHRGELHHGVEDPVDVGPVSIPAWSAEPVRRASRHWLRGITMSGLVIVCAGLFYLAATREDDVDSDVPAMPVLADAEPAPSKSMENRFAAVIGSSSSEAAPDAAAKVATPSAGERISGPRDRAGATEAMRGADDRASRSALADAAPNATKPGPGAGRAAVPDPNPTQAPASATEKVEPTEASRAPAVAEDRPDKPDSVARRPRNGEEATGRVRLDRDEAPTLGATAQVASTSSKSEPLPAVATTQAESSVPSRTPAGDDIATRTSAAVDRSATNAHSEPAAPASDGDTLERFELARERLRSMVSYLRSRDSAPPAWSDTPGQQTAEQARAALHARNASARIERFALDPPKWRVSAAAVALEATYRVDANSRIMETGRFYLDMAWRDGDWKITRIEVLPTP